MKRSLPRILVERHASDQHTRTLSCWVSTLQTVIVRLGT